MPKLSPNQSQIIRIHPAIFFPLCLALLFTLLVAFRLSGTSIGLDWYFLYGEVESDPNLLSGNPRTIRSDEYAVETPWTVMESRVGFSQVNPFIGAGQNLILTDVPIRHWSLIFTPQNWGYFLLPLEYGFSFHWWFKGLIVILGVYLLAVKLMNGQRMFAALMALAAFYSPAVQWWYSTSLTETFGWFFLLLFLALQLVDAQTARQRVIYTALFTYAVGCFMFLGYIPGLIPTMLALVFLIVGLLAERFLRGGLRQAWSDPRLRRVLAGLFIALAVNLALLAAYAVDERTVIETVISSVYPGGRVEIGGNMQPAHLLGGFYNIQLLWDRAYYLTLDNQSEASSYFMFSLFLLPLFIFQQARLVWRRQRPDGLLIAALLFYLLALCWAFVGLPAWLSHLLLLDRVPAKRLITVFGSLNLLLVIYFFARPPFEPTRRNRVFATLYAAAIALFYFYAGWRIEAETPGFFFTPALIYLVPAFVFLLTAALMNRVKSLFAVGLLAFSLLTAFYINPLYRGLGVLRESQIAREIQQIAGQPQNEDAVWVFYDSVLSNFAAANGARVISATQYHPQPELWRSFDPQGRYAEIYNRYSHIQILPAAGDSIEFIQEREDAMLLKIHPCNPAFQGAGVRFFVFHEPVDYACLEPVTSVPYPNTSFYLYERK